MAKRKKKKTKILSSNLKVDMGNIDNAFDFGFGRALFKSQFGGKK